MITNLTNGERTIIGICTDMQEANEAPDLTGVIRTMLHMGLFIGLHHPEYAQAVLDDLPSGDRTEHMPGIAIDMMNDWPIAAVL